MGGAPFQPPGTRRSKCGIWIGLELRSLRGHSGLVNGVALSPDGRQAISTSDDTTLKVWDLEAGREMTPLRGHSGPVYSVAVSADWRRAVSASSDDTLKVWDIEAGRELLTLQGHRNVIAGVGMSAGLGGARFPLPGIVRSESGIWRLASGFALWWATLTGVLRVSVGADGRRAVSASKDTTLKLWDLESGFSIAAFTCDFPAYCCAFDSVDRPSLPSTAQAGSTTSRSIVITRLSMIKRSKTTCTSSASAMISPTPCVKICAT